ncbi:ras GTPase-activating-like protein IQGAP1 isoform X2 [Mizuhopecten yessoensis]|uniref:Ras GTPase-activating-like protein IQGAP1 n=1 Tax=Mizuhopecten yessoensis TaxID=6573 RepID=A0A210QG69_MIZYE|nr:ras GTPase-activating-like protein IQGAP1 isoform X2 [Mizuhopecten yessoensis]OWF47735.1 Ras GTPase-activating-like protein IQGAP1 [Mizuhopecten yessoensis]
MSTEMEVNDGHPGPRERLRSDGGRLTAEEMDSKRKQNIAYEYLCHLEEAKVWMAACINEELPPTTELEEGLRNGVFLAKLGHFLNPQIVPLKKIYDREQTRFQSRGLHFRHTDNINHWFSAMEKIGLPQIFYPETTDIYDRKNMPRTIYCLHALSLYCFKLGIAPQIQDLYGKVQFTEEEISAMRLELEKYGIQMPAFSKIGGILANELTVDDAALHAAIIAINEAVDHEKPEETLAALENPSAMLVNLRTEGSEDYQELLFCAKQTKRDIAHNKSLDPDGTYEHDVYDELLTQAEIQGNINKVNTIQALDRLNDALIKMDPKLLLQALKSQYLGLKGVQDDNIAYYEERLKESFENKQNNNGEEDVILEREEIQQAVSTANLDADVEYQKAQCVVAINTAINSGDPAVLMRVLQNPAAKLPPVIPYGDVLYLEEFFNMRQEKQDDLDYDEIFAAVKVLSAVAAINEAVEVGDQDATFKALANEDACIPNLEDQNLDRYQKGLVHARATKTESIQEADDESAMTAGVPCTLLTHFEICSCVDQVNQQVSEEHERVLAIGGINNAIKQGNPQVTLSALKEPTAKLQEVDDGNAYRYQVLLCREVASKEQQDSSDGDVELWVEEIQNAIGNANRDAEVGLKTSLAVEEVNKTSGENDSDLLLESLTSSDLALHSVVPDCKDMYLQRLLEAIDDKTQKGECGSGWMMNRLKDGSKFFYNTHDQEYAWSRQDGASKDHGLLTKEEVQKVVSEVTAEYDRELLFKANENFIVRIQSCVRGYLARKAYLERVNFMNTQLPAITKIQACWKGYKQRKDYQCRLTYLKDNHDTIVKLQSVIRMWRQAAKYRNRVKFFKDHEAEVIKIQAFVRSNKAKHDYKALMHEENPPLSVVQKFVHLLDTSDVDYSEEIELQKLRQQVVTEIRSTQKLEHDLDTMDIKIGLLIKNRITLQDVVTHDKKLTKHKEMSQSVPKGLKGLSKDCHDRLEAYQYLFYLLQTNPTYLAKLIFEMPQSRTTKFMESVIYSLFNYGSNQREEYLLLKLFRKALEEEIALKVDKMSDFVTGNPLVVKMIVGFNRNQRGQNSLREMLNPLVTEVIEDKNLHINTNPTDVYKSWINQTESQTGKASVLPYDVSIEQALSHDEVQKLIQQSKTKLQQVTDKFLTTILQSLDKIPYGMRYMAKVLREALMTKFPEAPEKDVLKIVGNLLYYRYINSAIVAPDAFDIINVGADKQLTNDQRRNLGSVAKILQFAAANKGFGGESAYLSSMNSYIREAHEKFKHYCMMACDVEELEPKFNVDQYSDIVTITKPVIYISVSEICDTHQMLVLHQDEIAPDSNDPLHELLEDLGEVPTVAELLGVDLPEEETMRNTVLAQLGTTEITLTLTNKFEVPEDDQSNVKQLLIRTKRLVVDVVACQPGDTLLQILESTATDEQEELHQALVKKRERRDRKASAKQGGKGLVRHPSMLSETMLSIQVMKTKIKKQLQNLELEGVLTRKNSYQGLVNMIAQDIRNQRRYRNSRKQELMRVRTTLKGLQEKRTFYESQIDYYNRYVKTCIENLQQKSNNRKSRGLFKRGDGKVSYESVKYSASKLHEKGVILDVEGLPNSQFKNVMFEIAATADPGTFDVNAKFMGVEMEKVELVFQDLLQLQYEGVAVIEMFNKARINVNLLIFLLNKKFYSRHSK